MTSSIGFDKKLFALHDLKSSNHSDFVNLLKYDLNNKAFYDDILVSNLTVNSYSLYSCNFNIDSLSMSVGDVKSIICDCHIPSDLSPSPTDDTPFTYYVGSTNGSYLYSYLTDNEIKSATIGSNGYLHLHGNFDFGGSNIDKVFKVIVKRIA